MNVKFHTEEYIGALVCALEDEYETVNSESSSSLANNNSEDEFSIEQPTQCGNSVAHNVIRNYSFMNSIVRMK